MKYTYKCKGTCAVTISLEIDEEKKLHNVQFIGGCDGNHKGIVRLVGKGGDIRQKYRQDAYADQSQSSTGKPIVFCSHLPTIN